MSEELARLERLERYEEILAALTPQQLVIVALRLDGYNLTEIAEVLGLTAGAASGRLNSARARLLARFPELAEQVDGRKFRVRARRGSGQDSRQEHAGMTDSQYAAVGSGSCGR